MKATRILAAGVLSVAMMATVGASASATSHSGRPPVGGPPVTDQSLRGLAKWNKLQVGTAVNMTALAEDETYRDRIATEFSSVTAENVMKWETLEPVRGERDYGPADELVDFARRNKQVVRGHVLVWHNQNPAWLTEGVESGEIDATELRQILREHVTETVRHFKGRIHQWDVANEIFDDNAELRDSIWLRELGPSYIADAFRWAHRADPTAKLFLNDYNVEGISAKSTAYYDLVRELRRQRVPVHGMGIQGHLGIQYGFWSATAVAENLRRFEALGLETAVTEADVRMPMPTDVIKLQSQAQGYNTLLQGCLLADRCNSFTFWGFTDKYSWVPDWFDGEGAANILDEEYQPKPAYDAVRATLGLAVPTRR
ncbi:endo-1,4-beta-xylanase [Solwaraspora sp. WMMD792]|uniref:endo-1,4-beta-xylanase n=1 Tax=Solwaraspora sp. WMMD792 TaxID=3016099 RepID=UPI002417C787|nr:endo-1,4-beta-xylanase [Solwaraspora sp. WMMD792]MDG4769473.1 endo-1,4-beta-xylanase [Solwaraspora sp. WMMD792]